MLKRNGETLQFVCFFGAGEESCGKREKEKIKFKNEVIKNKTKNKRKKFKL